MEERCNTIAVEVHCGAGCSEVEVVPGSVEWQAGM